MAIQAAPQVPSTVGKIIQRLGYRGFERGIIYGGQLATQLFDKKVQEADLPTLIIMVHQMALTNPQYSNSLTVFKIVGQTAKFIGAVVGTIIAVNFISVKIALYQAFTGYVTSARGELAVFLSRGMDYSVYSKAVADLAGCKTSEEVRQLMVAAQKISINT